MRKENLWGEWVLENAEHLAAYCPYFGYLIRSYVIFLLSIIIYLAFL